MAEPKTFSLLDIDFTATQPFEAGHTCTEAEARVLNQVRKENLANNFRPKVAKAKEEAEKAGTAVDVEALTAEFTKLDGEYEFTLASVAASRKLDPVEREMRNLIKQALREQLAEESPARKLADLGDEGLEEAIEANMDNEQIRAMAQDIVSKRSQIAGVSLKK